MGTKWGFRGKLYFAGHRLVGMDIETAYRRFLAEDRRVPGEEITRNLLVDLLVHCREHVPYYADWMAEAGGDFRQDPEAYLERLPRLSKATVMENFERLKSDDLKKRKWRMNLTGGSTGEPFAFVQDNSFLARISALQWLSHDWAGRRFGEPGLRIWGSADDILKRSVGLKMKIINYLTNDTWFNAFRMQPEKMRRLLMDISENPPCLIIGYSQNLYEFARFAENEGIQVAAQNSILSSAEMLYPFMRQQLEKTFGCPVFDRYGSRELGDVACECEMHQGMHIFPWGNYIEILDEDGRRLPPGQEGSIVVTNLSNYAMPLVRYETGDRGALSFHRACSCGRSGPILQQILGRETQLLRTPDGTLLDGYIFVLILGKRPWVQKYQIVQTHLNRVVYRIIRTDQREAPGELAEVSEKARRVLGPDCEVAFEFPVELPVTPSGKHMYIFSELDQEESTKVM